MKNTVFCTLIFSGKHKCLKCGNGEPVNGEEVQKCRQVRCAKYYHPQCFTEFYHSDKEAFICPLHYCTTCAAAGYLKVAREGIKILIFAISLLTLTMILWE